MESLEGIWLPIAAELAGEAAPAMVLAKTEVELADGRYLVRFGGAIADHGTYVAADGRLTLTGVAGPNAGRVIPCLFRFVGDTLSICYGLDGCLPTAFATAPGGQLYLVTYRRGTR
ncbi:MAG: hypothetical protein JNG83_10120 [Opitutaceae bacterium]|nr:hypothetical protein [Opitutaceae bacterium]